MRFATPEIGLQMYRALRNAPCYCCRKWDKESKTEDGYTVTKVCGIHLAIYAYEALPNINVEDLEMTIDVYEGMHP
jgi:hypothetical protein